MLRRGCRRDGAGSEALQSQMAQLSELSGARLRARVQAEAKGDYDQRKQAVEQLISPLRSGLAGVRAVLALDQERRESRQDPATHARRHQRRAAARRNRGRWSRPAKAPTRAASGARCSSVTWSSSPACSRTATSPSSPSWAAARRCCVPIRSSTCRVSTCAKAPLQGVLDAYQARDEEERQRHLRDLAGCCASASRRSPTGLLGRARFAGRPGRHVPARRPLQRGARRPTRG